VRVAVVDVDGDGDHKADVVTGGAGQPARARLYLGKDVGGTAEPTFQDLDPFVGIGLADGVHVG
jgi:hypothetical protein